MEINEITQNILLLLNHKATPEQAEEIRLWLQESEENRIAYQQICETYYRLNYSKQWEKIDVSLGVTKVTRRIQRKSGFTPWRYRLFGIAAFLILCLSMTFLFRHYGKITSSEVGMEEVRSGEMKAMLTLANGQKVVLDATNKTNVDLGFAIAIEDSILGLRYQFKDSATAPCEYNTLTVPRAGEYIMVLADGSRVWLNSETELKYPVVFNAQKREVYLTGEAYFEVVKDSRRPFLVHTPQTTTTVLGTSFNITAYQDEDQTQITLVEGAVAVNAGNNSCQITPGYQVSVDNASMHMQQIPVNLNFYTSWKDGIFDFDGMTLGELATKLSRWYDVDFFFANPGAAEKRFTGAIKRNNTLQFMLDFVQKASGVRFEIKGKTVSVYNQ